MERTRSGLEDHPSGVSEGIKVVVRNDVQCEREWVLYPSPDALLLPSQNGFTIPNMVRVCPNGHRQQQLATQRERNVRKQARHTWMLVAQSAPHPRGSTAALTPTRTRAVISELGTVHGGKGARERLPNVT